MNFPKYIKVKKTNMSKEVKTNFQYIYSSLKKSMREKDPNYFTIVCHDQNEYNFVLALTSEFLSRYLLLTGADDLFEIGEMDGISEDRICEAINFCSEPVIKYGIYLTRVNLYMYLLINDILNLDSFMAFNMYRYMKECQESVFEVDTYNEIMLTANSEILDIEMLSENVETCQLVMENNKFPNIKDLKIFENDGMIKGMDEKGNILTTEYIYSTYKIMLEDFSDSQIVAFLVPVLKPKRIIIFAGVEEETSTYIKNIITGLDEFYSEYKIFQADEIRPI